MGVRKHYGVVCKKERFPEIAVRDKFENCRVTHVTDECFVDEYFHDVYVYDAELLDMTLSTKIVLNLHETEFLKFKSSKLTQVEYLREYLQANLQYTHNGFSHLQVIPNLTNSTVEGSYTQSLNRKRKKRICS